MLHFLIVAWLLATVQAGCPLSPTSNQTSSARLPGDGDYRILISGDYDKYIPNAVYVISLQGASVYESSNKFSRFTLSVDSEHVPLSPAARIGFFQIFPDSLAEFNENCINTVSEISNYPKSEVRVMWRAPPAGSGCVVFTAMVMESSTKWFAEDGKLLKSFCEMSSEETEQLDDLRCCACDEAKYKIVMEGLWSKATHPKDFPESAWLTHFSDLVGASHETNFSFWGLNHVATDGFRQLAEWGSASGLQAELRTNAKYLRTYIKAPGLWYPNVNSKTQATFNVDRKHPLLSVASMLGPSPDWVVGVSKLNLCRRNCSWIERLEVDLYPWDAGTDNGISYMSHNSESHPREHMKPITAAYPEDPRSPFFDPSGAAMKPLARLFIHREETRPGTCTDQDLDYVVAEFGLAETNDGTERPECMTTEYSDWTECSVSCGKGLRMRTRAYRIPEKAAMMGCSRQLVSKEMCLAPAGECSSANGTRESPFGDHNESDCATSEWSPWTSCDPSCSTRFKTRQRKLTNMKNRKLCNYVKLVERVQCDQCSSPDKNQREICSTTEWSNWSPCTKTCGFGSQTRKRILLRYPENDEDCKKVRLAEHRQCPDLPKCSLDYRNAKEICSQEYKTGPCKGMFEKWYFNSQYSKCQTFVYGGCRGNKNNFDTLEECTSFCGSHLDGRSGNASTTSEPIDCIVSHWSAWSSCSVPCGTGTIFSTRFIKQMPNNGGKPCPASLERRRVCHNPACNPREITEFP